MWRHNKDNNTLLGGVPKDAGTTTTTVQHGVDIFLQNNHCNQNRYRNKIFVFYHTWYDFHNLQSLGHDFFICRITLHFEDFQSAVIRKKKKKKKIECPSKMYHIFICVS